MHISGPKPFYKMAGLPDDMSNGFVIGNLLTMLYKHTDVTMHVNYIVGALLGHDLTDVANITNQYDDYVKKSSLDELTRYVRLNFFYGIIFHLLLLYRSLLAVL